MKGLIILANGFEDVEAIATIDVLRRSNLNIITASISGFKEVVTQSGHTIMAMEHLKNINPSDFDFLILPGGGAVFKILNNFEIIDEIIDNFYFKNKLIACICAAPALVGKRGYFKGLDYTCFPGCEEIITEGNRLNDEVVVTDKFITAKAMYYSIDFALAIINKLQGQEQKNKILKSIQGN